jgi:hypothetical protein
VYNQAVRVVIRVDIRVVDIEFEFIVLYQSKTM